jgi:hypothetical protein
MTITKTLGVSGLLLAALAIPAAAQTALQRCLGIVPGREPSGKVGPTPATASWCAQLPGQALYDQAGRRFEGGDRAGAIQLALQAAQAGNPLAQMRLGLIFARGEGTAANPAASLRWFRAAAAQNEPESEYELGLIYEYGQSGDYARFGANDDWDAAARYWRASAEQGWSLGEYAMGRAYQYGIGVPVSPRDALYWYDRAAAQGHAQAAYFAKYIRDNHGFDGSTRDDYERKLLGPLMGRTMPFTPALGTVFHHLSERLAFVKGEYVMQENAKARANWDMQKRRYDECRQAGGGSCFAPVGPRPN